MTVWITSGLFFILYLFLPLEQNNQANSAPPTPPAACNIQVNAGPDLGICSPGDVILTGSTTGNPIFVEWSPSAGLNNPSSLNPVATITGPVTYTLTGWVADQSMPSLIVNGDFESGNTGISSDYTYVPDLPGNQTEIVNPGNYSIVNDPRKVHSNFRGCGDHTGNGDMMVVNGAYELQNVWCQTVTVSPNSWYDISAWVTSVHSASPAQLRFSINDVPIGPVVQATFLTCIWIPFHAYWNSGSNTTATICILNLNTATGGNDFALDDISMVPLCSVSDEVNITIQTDPTPTPVIDGPAQVCSGDVATYTATFPPGTGILSYQWTIPAGATIVSGQGTPQITLRWNQINQSMICLRIQTWCGSNEACYDVTITGLPQQSSINGPGSLCPSEILTLIIPQTGPVDTYQWNVPPQLTIVSGQGTNVIDVKWAAAGIAEVCVQVSNQCGTIEECTTLSLYPDHLTFMDTLLCAGTTLTVNGNSYGNGVWTGTELFTSIHGCDSIVEVSIQEAATPPLIIDAVLNAEFNGYGVPCFGDASASTHVNIISGGLAPYSFQWSDGQNKQTADKLAAGSYFVTVTDSEGCQTSDEIEITQPEPIQYEIEAKDVLCFEDENGSVELINTLGGVAPWLTSLNNNAYQQSLNYYNLIPGNHTLSIKDQNGCIVNDQFNINEPGLWTVELGQDTTIPFGDIVTLNPMIIGTPAGAVEVKWSDGLCDGCLTRSIVATSDITYHVMIIDENGCIHEDDIRIQINTDIFIPNVFSPNGDGSNDHFIIFSNAIEEIESLTIYDRWGNQVFQRSHIQPNDPSFGWDGYKNGSPLNSGVFAYKLIVKFKDGSTAAKSGDVTIIK